VTTTGHSEGLDGLTVLASWVGIALVGLLSFGGLTALNLRQAVSAGAVAVAASRPDTAVERCTGAARNALYGELGGGYSSATCRIQNGVVVVVASFHRGWVDIHASMTVPLSDR
jgi:hypothetical protein